MKALSWIVRIIAAIILLQTLFFKFSGAEESIYIFTKIGMEPWGRIGSGVGEFIASVLLLIPRTAWIGAFMALGIMAGAVLFHLTILGIEVMQDGGYLFGLAITVGVCSVITLVLHRRDIPFVNKRNIS
ncbi:DoxX family protein [Fulvivirga ulvae]|uniref:DoxX family membrane protein n=1 Tax=Fulvivirga ulvae TaxID=2904245 RepID=UPI001F320A98|nr:DoxX family membrane protein [Fulvivirga ulvae]UII30088.1 DoxX family protein [Fulvivirga ulvae]